MQNIGGFKFGGLVSDRHNIIVIVAEFNSAVEKADSQTIKFSSLPSFLAIQ